MADSSILPAERPSLLRPALALAAVVGFFGFHGTGGEWLDFQVQAWFWDGRDWLIPKDSGWSHKLAYTGPKVVLYAFALWLLWSIAFPARSPAWLGRRRAAYVFVSMAAIAIVSTQLRSVTQMATPRDLMVYGAVAPNAWEHLLLFDAKPAGYPSHAFPAGHASGGFALLCLAFAWDTAAARRRGVLIGGLYGGLMGLYQIARGEHFLSHTLATAALAWLLSAALARWLKPAEVSSTN
ncbi:MAG: phosphatase PAP2 family protein [Opitutales bacterium]